jgi:squalene synthase HpnC
LALPKPTTKSQVNSAEANRLGLAEEDDGGFGASIRNAFAPVAAPRAGDRLALKAAESYTRNLTHSHYENFSVVSALLPKHLRQDFCNVYAFCRIADDLGDEVGDSGQALLFLDAFRRQLICCYHQQAETAVFIALAETIKRHDIPMKPFDDLICAFEQDQKVNRYQHFEQVVDYCTRSADPVGRLVLYMCGYRDRERQQLSDKICTALQLINFWQDVRRDILERNRIYLPRGDMDRFGVTEEQIRAGQVTDGYRALLKFEVERTEQWFDEGAALLPLLAPEYRKQIALFVKGGRAICTAIRRQRFDTLTRRPKLSRWQKAGLIAGTFVGYLASTLRGGSRRLPEASPSVAPAAHERPPPSSPSPEATPSPKRNSRRSAERNDQGQRTGA